jgi:hypothetical protein
VGYAAGQSDSFKGTGVYSGIEFKREPEKLEDTVQMDKTSTTLSRKDTTSLKTAEESKDDTKIPFFGNSK